MKTIKIKIVEWNNEDNLKEEAEFNKKQNH